ncbi:hypothetical protein GCM10008966_15080 [Rhodovulum strictum]
MLLGAGVLGPSHDRDLGLHVGGEVWHVVTMPHPARGPIPNEASITHLIGAVLDERKDEWQTKSRDMRGKPFAHMDKEVIDPMLSITPNAARSSPWVVRKTTTA